MNLSELRALAKEQNIKNISRLKKEEIIEVLKQVLNTTSEENENHDEYSNNETKKETFILSCSLAP